MAESGWKEFKSGNNLRHKLRSASCKWRKSNRRVQNGIESILRH